MSFIVRPQACIISARTLLAAHVEAPCAREIFPLSFCFSSADGRRDVVAARELGLNE